MTPDNQSVGAAAGTTTFDIANTVPGSTMVWTAQVADGDWLTITGADNGTDNGTITVGFTQNDNTTGGRTATIRVTAFDAKDSPKEVTVIQAPAPEVTPTPTPALIPGDANGDGQVSFEDFSILQNNYGQTGKTFGDGDFNGDGQVTFEDFSILQNHYGESGGAVRSPSAVLADATGACRLARPPHPDGFGPGVSPPRLAGGMNDKPGHGPLPGPRPILNFGL